MDDDLICEDCELDYDECECGTDPSEYDEPDEHDPEPFDLDDYPEYDPYVGSSGPDYWQNDAGEWRCG